MEIGKSIKMAPNQAIPISWLFVPKTSVAIKIIINVWIIVTAIGIFFVIFIDNDKLSSAGFLRVCFGALVRFFYYWTIFSFTSIDGSSHEIIQRKKKERHKIKEICQNSSSHFGSFFMSKSPVIATRKGIIKMKLFSCKNSWVK